MRSAQDTIGVSDASLSAHRTKTSPHVLGLKLGCTFSKGVAPRRSLRIVRRQTDDVGKIDVQIKLQNERGKTAMLELEKEDDRIDRELSEDLSAEQEIEDEKANEVSMKLKSTSDEETSLSFNDLENTQNTSGETATSSAKDGGRDTHSSTCKSGTMKSSSSSSEEGEDSNSNNSHSQDNGDGNADSEEYEDAYDDEDEGEDEYNVSVDSQSAKIDVGDDTDKTSKVNLQRKEIGDKGVQYTISGPLPKYDILAQLPKSDMKGFISPKAKQEGFIPVAWNQGMVKSTNSEVPPVIGEADGNIWKGRNIQQNMSTDDIQHPSTATDDLALIDPSNVDALPENIFNEYQPPLTSTPKASKEKIQEQCNHSTDATTDINKQSKPQNDGVANGSSSDGYDETTKDKTHELSGGDETNKPPKKSQRIPDHRFEEILKCTLS